MEWWWQGFLRNVVAISILKFIMKKHRTRENAVLYGIGHGAIEVLTVCPSINSALLSDCDINSEWKCRFYGDGITCYWKECSLRYAKFFKLQHSLMSKQLWWRFSKRISSMGIHIGCTIIVYYSVIAENKKIFMRCHFTTYDGGLLCSALSTKCRGSWDCWDWNFSYGNRHCMDCDKNI